MVLLCLRAELGKYKNSTSFSVIKLYIIIINGRDGKQYILRSPKTLDAEKMINYLKTIAKETEYGVSYPEELDFSTKYVINNWS